MHVRVHPYMRQQGTLPRNPLFKDLRTPLETNPDLSRLLAWTTRRSLQVSRGFRVSPIAGSGGEPDPGVMVDIMNACNEVDRLEHNESVEDVRRLFADIKDCNPSTDMRFALENGLPIGYPRVFWKDERGGLRLYIPIGLITPRWRRRGLGGDMLRWSEKRLCEIAKTYEHVEEKAFHAWATDREPGAMALFETHGYQVARTMVEMIRPMGPSLADAPIPEALKLRPACADEYRSILDAWAEAYADHLGSMERTEEDHRRWTESRLFQSELWKIAWDGKEVAGLVLNSIDERRNEWIGIARGCTQ